MADLNKIPKRSILRKLFSYDTDTGTLYWKISTNNRVRVGQIAGAEHATKYGKTGYRTVSINKIPYLVHRIIWVLMIGDIPDGLEIDHIDRDTSNNKLDNLRLVTHSFNMKNRSKTKKPLSKPPSSSSTKELHIHFCKTHNRFKVTFPRGKHRGSFVSINEAISKRDEILAQYRGN